MPILKRIQSPKLIASFLNLTALFIILDNLAGERGLLRKIIEGVDYVTYVSGSGVFGALVLIAIAHGIARRKSISWWLAVIYFGLDIILNTLIFSIFGAGSYASAGGYVTLTVETAYLLQAITNFTVSLIFFTLLLVTRRQYTAPIRGKSIAQATFIFIIGIVTTLLGSLIIASTMLYYSEHSNGVTSFIQQYVLRGRSIDENVEIVMNLGLGLSFLIAFFFLVRTVVVDERVELSQELKLRRLLTAPDSHSDSLGYFATRRDKAVVFSPNEKAAVTYRRIGGVCLASGDPVGPVEQWDGAIREFLKIASKQGLAPAVVGASAAGGKAYSAQGLKVRAIGDEAVLTTARFNLDNPKLRQVRTLVNRLQKDGYEVRIRRHQNISEAEMQRLIGLADKWRQNGDDRGFSMALNRLNDPLDGRCVFVEALDADGETRGLLSFVPWGAHGLSLDVMRRDTEHAENGVTEFMVASLMTNAADIGVTEVSLNFAVLREVIEAGEDVGATIMERLKVAVISLLSKRFQIVQLYRSNLKYDPKWVGRYFCWRDSADLANIGVAVGLAEGQISLPFAPQVLPQPLYNPRDPEIVEFLAESVAILPDRKVSQQVAQRMTKRADMLTGGAQPYPASFTRDQRVGEVISASPGTSVRCAGRVVARRDHGGVIFLDVQDWTGTVQLLASAAQVGADTMRILRRDLSIGDHLGFWGAVGTSANGTFSVLLEGAQITSKALQPIPALWQGLTDEQMKVRRRYLDLIVNPVARERVRVRSQVIQSIRQTLLDDTFLEVETPLLQTIHGGANARPFRTYINAYNLDLYLRIAPELYLKRLMVGGADRVFEIGRNFRNEGADATHNPEFTMLEAYQAYGDYNSMRELTQRIIVNAAKTALGTTVIRGMASDGQIHEVDLAQPWRVITVHQGIAEACGRDVTVDTPVSELLEIAAEHGLEVDPGISRGQLILDLHEELAEQHTIAPTFYCDFPTEVSPLTRQHREDERIAEKWDLICFGAEVATAYSELVDPVVQRERLLAQSLLAANGDPEAMEVDEDFLLALEYAMPPSGGMGMGVDRLVMMLTQTSIRETIIFPLVKPQKN
ncbi:lysine--tRNA ligase [Gleimia coleocanis DSM 15436]|uniref:Lysine--tRNA ligase n=1 Tax=Gleimia coleocanis DSM 15436 TaxID=525245 RepID=C0VYH9_9ACTO|nr:bifunctional lysylphosphatidylglycerol synthetase/lysine--tRNA ligase LysX [Gleimia coleocanis]EEH64482.1 lysine--tRNA ligase [Gleimia coleocanis DSM 15436]